MQNFVQLRTFRRLQTENLASMRAKSKCCGYRKSCIVAEGLTLLWISLRPDENNAKRTR